MAGKADLVNGIVAADGAWPWQLSQAAMPGEFPWQLSQGQTTDAAPGGSLALDPFGG